ncbi:MAG: LytTR family DNA-binding domain-containing protein [Lachnospiraceae bacterium]|nr:LytTR family DNA-binding domain-containing protein [Lachnospiraceae bacterium]
MDKLIFSGKYTNELIIWICEDSKEQQTEFAQKVKKAAKISGCKISVAVFGTGEELLEKLHLQVSRQKELPQIIFSDIQMPGINGVDLGKQIHHLAPKVYLIFITAYENYAVAGYEARAYRYLLKPIHEDMFAKVLRQILLEKAEDKHLMLGNSQKKTLVPLGNILYMCAEDKYTVVYTTDTSYVERKSLQEYEKALIPYGFFRVHRKILVNLRHHKAMEKGKIIISGGQVLPISRRKEKEYQEQFYTFLKQGICEP